MKKARSAISAILAIVVVIVIIGAAGAAVFFVLPSLGGGGSSSSTTSTTTTGSSSTPSTTTSTSASSSSSSSASSSSSTSSTTSSTTSTSSSTSSSTSTSSAASCTTTYTSATGTVDYTVQYIGLIKSFTQMTFRVHETNGTTTHDENLTYQVTSNNAGVINVNFTLTSSGNSPVSASAQVNSNNDTVLSFTFGTYTFTGQNAKSEFDGFMALFGLEETFSSQLSIFTASAYFHSTGTAPMTFGSTTFDVTTWVANTLPMDVSQCGYNATITAYTLQFGTPPTTSLTFITYLHVATSSPNNEDITFQLVSMTQA